jgi:hypothetical protein
MGIVPQVPYHPTPTLLDLARVLAGADLFIGNQSAPRALAESLKVPVWVEEDKRIPDTKFLRTDAWYHPGNFVQIKAALTNSRSICEQEKMYPIRDGR